MKRGLVLLVLFGCGSVTAQPSEPVDPALAAFALRPAAAPAEPNAIPLYPGVAPGSEGSEAVEVWARMGPGDLRVVRNVTHPTLTPILPKLGEATGAAVIVAPGGGFQLLAMDQEGWPVAEGLADRGIAAFVLKYRLNETPADEQAYMEQIRAGFEAVAQGRQLEVKEPRATEDALRALALVRAKATDWNIDPARVGMIGFSAGAMTALHAGLAPDPAERPAFIGYIYGPMTAIEVPADAPPLFGALAIDDPLFGQQGFGIVDAWREAKRPVELHAYEKGGHGFGLGAPGTTTTAVLPAFVAWLQSRGLLSGGG